jgi:hypothetical protein
LRDKIDENIRKTLNLGNEEIDEKRRQEFARKVFYEENHKKI